MAKLMSLLVRRKIVFAFFAVLLSASALVPNLAAQTASRIKEDILENDVARLQSTTHPLARPEFDRGRVSADLPLNRMFLVLKRSSEQEAALGKLLNDLQNSKSPSYHKWLTPEEYAAKFAPSSADVQKITGWLTQHGFQVGQIARGGQWIEFSGSATQVEQAFNTEMHHFEMNGERYVANSRDISVPRALLPVVHGMLSLNSFPRHEMHSKSAKAKRINGVLTRMDSLPDQQPGMSESNPLLTTTPGPKSTAAHFLSPGDLQQIYNIAPLLKSGTDGTGVEIAIVARSNIQMSDVETFRQIFGLPPNDPQIIINGEDPGIRGSEDEADLDVQWAGAMAPKATIKLVVSASTFVSDGSDLSAAYIVDNRVAPIMSMSFGICEMNLGPDGNAFFNSLWEQAVAEGITPLVSAGDNGPAGCDPFFNGAPAQFGLKVNGIASTPFDVAVGGTQFNENGLDGNFWLSNNRLDLSSAIGYIPEAVWNESCDPTVDPRQCADSAGRGRFSFLSGSGGASNCTTFDVSGSICSGGYSKPAWQMGPGVPADGARDIPDVSLTAALHDGYLFCLEGSCQTSVDDSGNRVIQNADIISGTSASAPAMAGILALVEQKNGAFQGQVNYTLYKMAASADPTACNSASLTDPSQASSCNFFDTTVGNNNVPGQNGFDAVPGYDLATGLGSVNAANLVANWIQVNSVPSATALSAEVTSAKHGDPVTLNISVASPSGSGTPSGDVALMTDKFGPAGFVTLTNGTFSGPVTTLPGGSYNLTAHYAGDAIFAASDSSPIAVNIAKEDSVINATGFWQNINFFNPKIPLADLSNPPYGSRIILEMNVAGASGAQVPATGTLTILDGITVLGSVPLSQTGNTSVVTASLTGGIRPDVGVHNYSVQYSGDNNYNPSVTAQPITAVIITSLARTQVRVDLGLTTGVPAGTPLTITMQVTPLGTLDGGPTPTGTAQLFDNGNPAGPVVPLVFDGVVGPSTGQATTVVTLPVGLHQLETVYFGDSRFEASPAGSLTNGLNIFNVNPAVGAPAAIVLTQSDPTIPVGQSATYVISAAPATAGGPLPTGKVSLVGFDGILANDVNGVAVPLTLPLVNGHATFTFVWGNVGPKPVRAQYSGDAHYGPNASNSVTTTVSAVTPVVNISSNVSSVLPNHNLQLSVQVLGSSNPNISLPFGTVQFFDSLNGAAPQPVGPAQQLVQGNGNFTIATIQTTLPAGMNTVTAQYGGGGISTAFGVLVQWAAATSANSASVDVTTADFSATTTQNTLLVPAFGGGSTTLTLTPLVGFTGNVTLACSGLPAGSACAFTPAAVALSGTPVTDILTLNTAGPGIATASANPLAHSGWLVSSASFGLLAFALFAMPRRRRQVSAVCLLLLGGWAFMAACGGGSASSGGRAPSTVSLQTSAAKVPSGGNLTLTAMVSSTKTPTGMVIFLDGATQIGSQSLSNGQASIQLNALAIGTHAITARYGGDANSGSAVSQVVLQAVTGNTTLQVTATSGSLSHVLMVPVTIQ